MSDHLSNTNISIHQRRAAYLQRVRDLVAEHGWMIQGVFPTADSDDDEPGFAYTVGLAVFHHPEIIVFGLSADVAEGVLNDIGRRVRDGETFAQQAYERVFGDHYPAWFIHCAAEETERLLTVSAAIHGGPVDALQLVWPDVERRFPWDDGYAPPGPQPLLGEAPR